MLKFFKSFFHRRHAPEPLPAQPEAPYKVETPAAPVAESTNPWPFPTAQPQPEVKAEEPVKKPAAKKPAAKTQTKKSATESKVKKPSAAKVTESKKPARRQPAK